MDYYINFMKTGNPNSGSQRVNTIWPNYLNTSRLNLEIEESIKYNINFRGEYSDFWDQIGYNQ